MVHNRAVTVDLSVVHFLNRSETILAFSVRK